MMATHSSFGSRFLGDPQHRPQQHTSGTGCGAESLLIEFAGGRYLFTGLSPAQRDAVSRRFAGLCRQAGDGDAASAVATRVLAAGEGFFRDPAFAGEDYYFDTEFASGSVCLAGWNFFAGVQRGPALNGRLWVRPSDDLIRFGVFENYFRVLVANDLLARGGVLLHSAAVTHDGWARVFFGRSNAGKSTVSRLGAQRGLGVLSDDLNALTVDAGRLWCRKIPFAGDFGATGGRADEVYPVAGLYSLKQSDGDALAPLRSAEALSRLVVCAPFVNTDPAHGEQLVMNLARIVEQLPVQELRFTLDGTFWDAVLSDPYPSDTAPARRD